MAQKLLIMERDTKQNLEEAIKKELKNALFEVKGLSVLKQTRLNFKEANNEEYFEAWIIIDDKSDYIAGFE